MKEAEGLVLLRQQDRVLIRIVITEHRAAHQIVAVLLQDLRHLLKGNQVLLLRLLKALQMNRDRLTERLRPALAIVILLDELTKDLRP